MADTARALWICRFSDQLVELTHDGLGYVGEIVDPLLQGHCTPLVMIFPYQRPDLPQACQGTIVPVAGMGVSERMQKKRSWQWG